MIFHLSGILRTIKKKILPLKRHWYTVVCDSCHNLYCWSNVFSVDISEVILWANPFKESETVSIKG